MCQLILTKSLNSIKLPKDLTSIGSNAFWNCSSLNSIELPESLTSIRGDAFSGHHLSHIEIPESVTNIEEGAFRGESLVDIEVSAQNTMYTVYEGCLYDKQYDFVKIS